MHILPSGLYRTIVRATRYPPVAGIDLGDLRRLKPISRVWGLDRGQPVDRYYINQFLSANAADIRGHVLEIGESKYTMRYGDDRVAETDILHVSAESPNATIVADLAAADHIPSDLFDCIICTQTLHLIYEIPLAICTLSRILRPGGVLLVTLPGISQISRYDMDRWGDYWRFTSASTKQLFAATFLEQNVDLSVYGNVLAAVAFLHGLAAKELEQQELEYTDPDYEVLIAVRAVKAESGG
jgi:SAM-dependent methyltransferase